MDNKKGRNIAVLTIFLCIFSFISDKLSTKYSLGMMIFHKLLLPAKYSEKIYHSYKNIEGSNVIQKRKRNLTILLEKSHFISYNSSKRSHLNARLRGIVQCFSLLVSWLCLGAPINPYDNGNKSQQP